MTGNSAEFQDATDKLRKSLKKGATVHGDKAMSNVKDVGAKKRHQHILSVVESRRLRVACDNKRDFKYKVDS